MITTQAVWDHLQELKDPMFGEPLSVVDVGLVHAVEISGADVHVSIVMFNRGRVYIDAAASPIRQHLLKLKGVGRVEVECLWEVEWSPQRLSARAREVLGFTADDPVEGRMHVRAVQKADPDAAAVEERFLERGPAALGPASLPLADLPRDRFRAWWGGWRFFKRFRMEETAGLSRHEPMRLDSPPQSCGELTVGNTEDTPA